MRILIAGAMVLLLAGAAFAQAPGLNLGAFEKKKDPAQQQKEEEIDRAYRDATQGSKAVTTSPNDPWGAVRAAEQPAARPKAAAKPKAQTQTHARPQAQARQTQPKTQSQPQAQSPWPAAPKPQAQAQSPWPSPQPQAQAQSPWPATPR